MVVESDLKLQQWLADFLKQLGLRRQELKCSTYIFCLLIIIGPHDDELARNTAAVIDAAARALTLARPRELARTLAPFRTFDHGFGPVIETAACARALR